jgi:oligoendopeptidase F
MATLMVRLDDWNSVSPYVRKLLNDKWHNFSDFQRWLRKLNELETVIKEEATWKLIRYLQNMQDKDNKSAYEHYLKEIKPRFSKALYHIYKRYWHSPWRSMFPKEKFLNFNRTVYNYISLYNPQNVVLETKAELLANKCNEIMEMIEEETVEVDGEILTLSEASSLLNSSDREKRREVWKKIYKIDATYQERLDDIMSELISIRTQIAKNSGFENYYDYRFQQLGRFDWNVDLCHKFHRLVEKVVKPLYGWLLSYRRRRLGLKTLYPWDLYLDINDADKPLEPFQTEDELIEKSLVLFERLHPKISAYIRYLRDIGHLDLSPRPGKTPTDYCLTLPESGLPFILLSANGTHSDLVNFIHETGHAIHVLQSRHIPYLLLREYPMEVAELASISLEMMTMYHMNIFYPSLRDLGRAWFEQISQIITSLPWIATVDAFQEWLYKNPHHTPKERRAVWVKIYRRFHGDIVAWPEEALGILWQQKIHIFDSPLYYIEYGIAQIGALQLWYNYDRNPHETIKRYLYALSLGYTKRVPEIYKAAGIQFWFDIPLMKKLARFIISKIKDVLN